MQNRYKQDWYRRICLMLLAVTATQSIAFNTRASGLSIVISESDLDLAFPALSGLKPLSMLADGDEFAFLAFDQSGFNDAVIRGSIDNPPGQVVVQDAVTLSPDTGDAFTAILSQQFHQGRLSFFGLSRSTPDSPPDFGIFYQDTPGGPILSVTQNYAGNRPNAEYAASFDYYAWSRFTTGPELYQLQTGGVPALLIDQSTPVPGSPGEFFEGNINVGIGGQSGATTAFIGGYTGVEGIYHALKNQSPRLIANTNMIAPNETTGRFDALQSPVIDGQTTVFVAKVFGESDESLFAEIDGELIEVADVSIMNTFGFGNSLDIGAPIFLNPAIAVSNKTIVFRASGIGIVGLYQYHPATGVSEIVRNGDIVDGLTLTDFDITPDSIADGRLIFNATYGDPLAPDIGIFSATLVASLPADLDGDGDVDDADFGLAFAAFTGPGNGPSSNPLADLDNDGDVDDADFGLAFAAFTGPGQAANVPEPGALVVMGVVGAAGLRRRR